MFFSFIAGLVFGVGSAYVEKAAGPTLRKNMDFTDSELSIVSFAALMLVASIIVAALGFNSSAFWLVLGGAIGAFAIRGYALGKSKMDERKELAAAKDVVEETIDEARGAN